jgi:hypothetical protein
MKKIIQGQFKLINIMRQIFYVSGKVIENFDVSIIGAIFVCCQIDMWTMKIRIIPSINALYFRIHLE